jgi:hypothetical protein
MGNFMRLPAGDVLALEQYLTCTWLDKTCYAINQGGLP